MNASAQRSRSAVGAAVAGTGIGGIISNQFSTSTSASWAPDLWGKIRRTVEGDVASAQASAGNLASARLSAQGALASDYLQLRMSDELKRLFDAAASYYAESLSITPQPVSERHRGPVGRLPGRDATRKHASAGDRGLTV